MDGLSGSETGQGARGRPAGGAPKEPAERGEARGPILGLDHVQLAMPPGGEERATAFYAGLLGLRPVPKPEPLAARGGCWFLGPPGTPALHLGIEADFRAARKAHPAFVVADLDALESALEAAGHPVVPDVAVDGRRRSFVDDPFGNRVELVEAGAG